MELMWTFSFSISNVEWRQDTIMETKAIWQQDIQEHVIKMNLHSSYIEFDYVHLLIWTSCLIFFCSLKNMDTNSKWKKHY